VSANGSIESEVERRPNRRVLCGVLRPLILSGNDDHHRLEHIGSSCSVNSFIEQSINSIT